MHVFKLETKFAEIQCGNNAMHIYIVTSVETLKLVSDITKHQNHLFYCQFLQATSTPNLYTFKSHKLFQLNHTNLWFGYPVKRCAFYLPTCKLTWKSSVQNYLIKSVKCFDYKGYKVTWLNPFSSSSCDNMNQNYSSELISLVHKESLSSTEKASTCFHGEDSFRMHHSMKTVQVLIEKKLLVSMGY